MFAANSLTSELEAVNMMLSLIQQQPVSTLAYASSNSDVSGALMALRMECRLVQGVGWSFNTDLKLPLTPDPVTGKITPAAGAVKVRMRYDDPSMRGVVATLRSDGGTMRIYDRTNFTFVWTRTVLADQTVLCNFEDMPEAVRLYTAIRAGRKFQVRAVGSAQSFQLTQTDEEQALAEAGMYMIEDDNPNFLNDSYDVAVGWALGRE